MSTNSKNVIRESFLYNFTQKRKHRYIVTEKGSQLDSIIQKNLRKINKVVNLGVQEISTRVYERQIPYIVVEQLPYSFDQGSFCIDKEEKKQRVRGIMRDIDTENQMVISCMDGILNMELQISHKIEFFTSTTYNSLTFSNIECDAKLLLDRAHVVSAIADIFLDSAMFNSFSFLKEMPLERKREFGKQKLEFYKKKGLPCFYRFDAEDQERLSYYSLAFSCRKDTDEIDYDLYIQLWNEFIQEYYSKYAHKEKNIPEQLNQYIDAKQLPAKIRNQLSNKKEGAYLILKTNKNRTTSLQPRICSVFGMKEFKVGEFKVVGLERFDELKPMFVNLDVSAYKVVKIRRRNIKK